MAAYKGSIELISGITQKNGGDFPLVDASAVQVDDTGKRLDVKLKELEQNAGVKDYSSLTNKPSINGVELLGDKSLTDLGVLDDQLTTSGKAADAKAVGDKFTTIQSTLDNNVVKTIKINGVEQTLTSGEVNLPAYPTKESLGLGNVSNTPDAEKQVASAGKLTTPRTIALTGGVTGSATFDGSADASIEATVQTVSADKITGVINIANLPKGALERCVVVANEDARYALTTENVQTGDTVKEQDTGLMYFVVDDTKLNEAAGYEAYTAGQASSVPWSGITGKPSSFTPEAHTHAIADVTGLQAELKAKALATDLTSHTGNSDIHVTTTDKQNWNAAKTHADSAHARTDATKTAKSTTNGNILINDTETPVYTHPSHTQHAEGLYKITVDESGHVSGATAVSKEDITGLGVAGEDTGVTSVVANNGLTQNISGRQLTLGISSVSTDLLTQGSDTIIINGGRKQQESP